MKIVIAKGISLLINWYSISVIDTLMFRGKNGLSQEIFLLLIEGHLRIVLWGFQSNSIYHQGA
jgi:hypothetical protein